MSEQKLDSSVDAEKGDDGRRVLKIAVIVFAIVEALVLIPGILYTILR